MTRHERQWGYSALRRSLGIVMLCIATVAGAQPASTPASATGTASLLDQTFDFDVPAQQVSTAILDIARQASVQALMAGNVLDEYPAEALNGNLTLADALERVLADTPYAYLQTGRNAIMVGTPEALASVPDDPKSPAVPADSNTGTAAEPEAPIADIDSARRAGVEEIIVTGQKKAERLQDVPIAISAFSMEQLDAQKVEGGFDLLKAVPNVTFSKTNFSGYNFQIRGIGTQAVSATTDPGVAVSFNNTTLIVNRLFEQEYLDIERVEVLRGPQGTLYGRNATSGVINVISNKAKINEFEAEIKGELGNYNAQRLRGHVNVPLIDNTLAMRVAYAMTDREGYGTNLAALDPNANAHVSRDVDGRDLWTGRVSLGWEPTDTLRVNLMWERFEEDDNRVRTSKQLCHRDDSPTEIMGVPVNAPSVQAATYSQGCEGGSLYSAGAYGTPNGESLPYISGIYWAQALSAVGQFVTDAPRKWYSPFGAGPSPYTVPDGNGQYPIFQNWMGPFDDPASAPCSAVTDTFGVTYTLDLCQPDPYGNQVQSQDLRSIYSLIEPTYQANADIFDLSFDFQWNDHLTLSSQTVYAKDEYWATQDYNRFSTFPIWNGAGASNACAVNEQSIFGFTIYGANCSDDPDNGRGTHLPLTDADGDGLIDQGVMFGGIDDHGYTVDENGQVRDAEGRRVGYYRHMLNNGGPNVFCDPQLGCSDKLIAQDLSRSTSTQWNQELRLISSYDGPVNFSIGANYTRFETVNDYFVFSNAFTHLLQLWPFNEPMSPCPAGSQDGSSCRYVDPNPLAKLDGEGHNYFRSANPYQLDSAAMFGELYWNVTDTLKLTVGARMNWDRKVFSPVPSQLLLSDYRQLSFVEDGDPPPVASVCGSNPPWCSFSGAAINGKGSPALPDIIQEWTEPTGRLVVDWKPDVAKRLGWSWLDESLLYASVARGYKGGGANPPTVSPPSGLLLQQASGTAVPPTFKPEYINALEIGAKNQLLGGVMTLNVGAFYYDYRDYQISKIVDRTAVNENVDATVWGLELEATVAPTSNTLFNASIGYLRTRIGDGEQSIDLMDRAQGGDQVFRTSIPNPDYNPDLQPGDPEYQEGLNGSAEQFIAYDHWTVVKPWVVAASNCVMPTELIAADFAQANMFNGVSAIGAINMCPVGGILGERDGSLGQIPYFEDGELIWNPLARSGGGTGIHPDHDGRVFRWALDAPNGGAGFFADLSGNELPNAPRFTVSLGAQHTLYLPGGWDLTGRVDWYWQDDSYARIYNTEYDQLKAWTNTNFSFWANQLDWGLRVEVYVKNAFDESPITGTFLNSDDSGLTTNVFTLDPRLVGLSITKRF
jgi:iron complex outermembrane recepter protein